MANLILVRHGESEWNAKDLWTGWTDIGLSEKGKKEARISGEKLKGFSIDIAFTSVLIRSKQTLDEMKSVLGIDIPTFEDKALNEKDYGDFTGKNKFDIKKQYGDEAFLKIRRSWDYQIPNGESLKQVYARVVPYFQNTILPYLRSGKNVLVSAHSNSLRALVKYLENISDKDIEKLEIATGEIYIYSMSSQGAVLSKEIR